MVVAWMGTMSTRPAIAVHEPEAGPHLPSGYADPGTCARTEVRDSTDTGKGRNRTRRAVV